MSFFVFVISFMIVLSFCRRLSIILRLRKDDIALLQFRGICATKDQDCDRQFYICSNRALILTVKFQKDQVSCEQEHR